MRSFTRLALVALPLFASAFAGEPASPTQQVDQSKPIYFSAQEAFRELLNALPEESLKAALSGLKGFQSGVFESHHRGVEQVHDKNPALATKLVIAAVHDLRKRQTPNNGTSVAPSPSPPTSATPPQSSNAPPPRQSSAAPSAAASSTTNTDRAVIVNVPQTTTDARGSTVVQTTSVLSQVTASVPVTVVRTNSQGQAVTSTENRPAVIQTTTDAQGRSTVITSAAQFAPTAGEVRTETDAGGSTFVTTYTPGGGKISSVKIITTTGADGKPSTVTSYTFVDPAQTPTQTPTQTGRPGLQSGAANAVRARELVIMGGAALALFV